MSTYAAQKAIRDFGKKCGRRLYAHLFRHSVATELYRRTKDLALVKDFLGHADISVTDRYYRGTNEEHIKRDVLTAMDGRQAQSIVG